MAIAFGVGRQAFLEHNLLAISSLYSHLRSSVSAQELYIAALSHHIEASRLFRRSVKSVTAKNWVAILGFAISAVIFHFTVSRGRGTQSILETMFVLRNAAVIAQLIEPWYNQSRIRVLVESQMHECNPRYWMDDVVEALNKLERLDDAATSTGSRHNDCHHAMTALQQWVYNMEGYPRSWTHFLWWPANVSVEYLRLLTVCDSWALVVFVYWCAIMTRAPKRWFLDRWSMTIAASAVKNLGTEWNAHIEWPLRVLGIRL